MIFPEKIMETETEGYCYQTLGLEPGASPEQIKTAYRALVNQWHPDKVSHNLKLQAIANEEMKSINAAYRVLCSRSVPPQASEATSRVWADERELEQQTEREAERRRRQQETAAAYRREQLIKAKARRDFETARRAKRKRLRHWMFGFLGAIYAMGIVVNVVSVQPGVFDIWMFLLFSAVGLGLISLYFILRET